MRAITKSEPWNHNRLQVVDSLRGIAALGVCLGHMALTNNGFSPNSILKKTVGGYGWLGVDIFFVISGFIIPYALHRAGYEIRQYGVFLLKRIIRLDPPYLVTLPFLILLGYVTAASPMFQGPPFHLSFLQVLLHAAYLNAFFGYEWLNPIFWSLAVEFQYYLVVGLLFPIISHKCFSVRWGLFALMSLLAILLPQINYVFHWLFLFMLGMLTFQFHAGIVHKKGFFLGLAVLASGACYAMGPLIAAVATGTAIAIAFAKLGGRILLFFGTISYSLYIIHVPIGLKAVNLGARFVSGSFGRSMIFLGAFVLTITASYVLYALVEKPARGWSAAIKYRRFRDGVKLGEV